MCAEFGPGSERGKKEAMAAMFPIIDAQFTNLFLDGQGHEEKDIDGAFVFYFDEVNGELVELNEIMEPAYTGYQAKRSVIIYDVEKIDGQYHVSYKGDEHSWYPETGFESFESLQADLDHMNDKEYSLLKHFAVIDVPEQNPDGNSIFRSIARTHAALMRPLKLIDQSELYKPKLA
jgi:hypothetical protein